MTARAGHIEPGTPPDSGGGPICPVAGVGASAGGLDSFTRMLRALPDRPGIALVLVQHLDPSHDSMLAEILRRESKMPVLEVVNGMPVEADHVYVMPPNVTIEIARGSFKLAPRRSTPDEHLPIDRFFQSLARECESRAVGVVLSGTGSDGARGLVAIREAGGLAFVQDPASAEYDGMPRAAIDAGAADAVLDPEAIAEQIVEFSRRLHNEPPGEPLVAEQVDEASLSAILKLVRAANGLDLTHYRRTTLLRRISRRMLLRGFDTLEQYANALRADGAEVDALYRDILVNVTEFFRDPGALDALMQVAFPAVLERKGPEATFRLWVPGCSKGQEAYSIVMSLVEFLESASIRPDIQMFASDVNELDVSFARAGIYPESIAREVSPERLARFFTQVPEGYRVDQALREMCVFAVHDITRDPPFSRLDVVSFRNVLIYMERSLQQRVLQILHYALEPGGFLLLGSSETTGGASSLFSVADKKHRLYIRKPGPARLLPSPERGASKLVAPGPTWTRGASPSFDPLLEADKIVLETYGLPGFLLNDAMDVLQLRGHVAEFLEPAQGPPAPTLSKMVAPALAATVRAAVREATKSGVAARRVARAKGKAGEQGGLTVEAVPILSPDGSHYYLILFEAKREPRSPSATSRADAGHANSDSTDVATLRRELDDTRENVEIVVAEKEAANRDLRMTGDRLQTTNEELRTINEELQTAQEELQSTNEELTTLNDELRNRNAELGQLTDDLDNVIEGVEIPILILGPDLLIHRFTPQAERVVSIKSSDVGRLVTDFTFKVDMPDFKQAVEAVVRSLEPSETDVQGTDGRWYSMRIRPYRTGQGGFEGVVVAFIDIDVAKRAMQSVEIARKHAEALVETVREPLLTLDSQLRVLEANQAFYDTFGVAVDETIGTQVYDLGNGQWNLPELRGLLEGILPGDQEFADLEVEHVFPGIGRRIMVLGARRVREEHGLPSILLSIDDVTQARRRARMDVALNDVSLKIGSTFDVDDVLDEVLEQSATAVSADSGAVLLKQRGAWLIKSVFGMDPATVGQCLDDDQVPLSLFSAEGGDPVLVADISKDERFSGSVGMDLGHHCVLMVPLLLRDETIGSVSFHHLAIGGTFDDADVRFAKRLGMLLSLAIENSQLYSAQRQIATTLQTALLTPPREIPGVEFGYLYRSATTAASVGGDLYDIFELSDHCVGILIGDVSGKGIEAATLAGVVKNTIRALSGGNDSPADIVAKTNNVLFRATTPELFVTLVLGLLDTRTGRLVYCSAGHPRGVVRRRNGEVAVLEGQSPLAGASEEVEFVNSEVSMSRGDTLILYTDGVTEARRASEFLGEEGLLAIVRAHSAVPTRELPKAVFADVLEYAEGQLADDVAIVSVALRQEASN